MSNNIAGSDDSSGDTLRVLQCAYYPLVEVLNASVSLV
jgi:hypothetical protein